MYTVEVCRQEQYFAGTLDHIKNWLDLHRVEAKDIQIGFAKDPVVFRVLFSHDHDAMAFARAFSGEVLSAIAA